MKVLVIKPGHIIEEAKIENTLKTLQSIVGGNIETISPFDDNLIIICNEEGKLKKLPVTAKLQTNTHNDILVGNLILCGTQKENFCSLTDEQISIYKCLLSS